MKSNQVPTLVLCRTPFQAVMLKQVLMREHIDRYDLVYFTQDNAAEDTYYYNELSLGAEHSQYLFLERQRFDIFNHIKAYWQIGKKIKKTNYGKILVSSIDNLAFRKIAVKNNNFHIISFDDGTGHINKNSDFFREEGRFKSLVYESAFRVPAIRKFAKQISRHYSAYRDFENIMPQKIISYVDIFKADNLDGNGPKLKFFIGQPFEEYKDDKYILNLKNYLREITFDFYVRHPRERFPLIDRFPFLLKQGKIAEEAIFSACKGRRPVIMGTFSTVLINISPAMADKIMILRRNVKHDDYYAELGKKAGCEIVFI